jgi:hypothetical protein
MRANNCERTTRHKSNFNKIIEEVNQLSQKLPDISQNFVPDDFNSKSMHYYNKVDYVKIEFVDYFVKLPTGQPARA